LPDRANFGKHDRKKLTTSAEVLRCLRVPVVISATISFCSVSNSYSAWLPELGYSVLTLHPQCCWSQIAAQQASCCYLWNCKCSMTKMDSVVCTSCPNARGC